MISLRTILNRIDPQAAEDQGHAREMTPFNYRSPQGRPIIVANQVHQRRHRRNREV